MAVGSRPMQLSLDAPGVGFTVADLEMFLAAVKQAGLGGDAKISARTRLLNGGAVRTLTVDGAVVIGPGVGFNPVAVRGDEPTERIPIIAGH